MKQLPEVNTSYAALYDLLIAPIRSKLLRIGIELKVFNHPSEPMSADSMLRAFGFRSVRSHTREGGGGQVDLDIWRKA